MPHLYKLHRKKTNKYKKEKKESRFNVRQKKKNVREKDVLIVQHFIPTYVKILVDLLNPPSISYGKMKQKEQNNKGNALC